MTTYATHPTTDIGVLIQLQYQLSLDNRARVVYPAGCPIYCQMTNQYHILPDLTGHRSITVIDALSQFSNIIPVRKLKWDEDKKCYVNVEKHLAIQQQVENQRIISSAAIAEPRDEVSHRLENRGDVFDFPPDPSDETLVAIIKTALNGREKHSVHGVTGNMLTCLRTRNSMQLATFEKWLRILGYSYEIVVKKNN